MESSIEGKDNLITEAVPHMNSLLIKLLGNKKINNLEFPHFNDEEGEIKFNYGECDVTYKFKLKEEPPRTYNFSINDVKFEKAGEPEEPKILLDNKTEIDIKDPLKVSIERFVSSFEDRKPLVPEEDVLRNVQIQDEIMSKLPKNE